jgi:hypothetical protein
MALSSGVLAVDVEHLIEHAAREHPDDVVLKQLLARLLRGLQPDDIRPRIVHEEADGC